MGLLFTCEDTVAALSDYLDGVLPLAAFLGIRAHLFNCPGCRTLLATLRALPTLAAAALAPQEEAPARARQALQGALARLAQSAAQVPLEARQVLATDPDLPMCLLARAHEHLARERGALPPPYPLPRDILDRLPPAEHWRWQEDGDGLRKAELCADARGGVRLLLVYAPPSSILQPHRHLGSESIVVLDGAMDDQGRGYGRGDWIHHGHGSCHAPRIAASGCWCLVREEGTVRLLGPAA
jgi:anti-sigma factor ChrR (cupin superfamily)